MDTIAALFSLGTVVLLIISLQARYKNNAKLIILIIATAILCAAANLLAFIFVIKNENTYFFNFICDLFILGTQILRLYLLKTNPPTRSNNVR
ncbi:hypothetical protein COT97_01990 [Candidatus Falkowbacteria bacterium CG10_big_fil_rev_8_21_14_0_10_39_11]|uniref:Uncharacterized protein n=1 Tax=Candidatus Falkowbacteria bacterium CG10_big_fil_rev_8_21_14_0_10_39_11 TaxID=1974565 RepID=A0A2H0V599_9BACT|nr:MAG: hypothetical protein COT97_01990 [Candidatus Falkowbacteria bacterium CG10_big_fil_rev_8_21_14_0_10_39_11]